MRKFSILSMAFLTILSFLLSSCRRNVPEVSTQKAIMLGNGKVRLNATVNPNGNSVTVYFEYGKSTDYGNTIDAFPNKLSGENFFSVIADLENLEPKTTYHYRVVAKYKKRKAAYGEDMTFTSPALEFKKNFGGSGPDAAQSIVETPDGGYIAVGTTGSNDGDVSGSHGANDMNNDIWVIKLDERGNLKWQRCFGGTENDVANQIIKTTDGNYVIVGNTFSSDGDVVGHHEGYYNMDAWIIKINNSGNILWQKCLGGSNDDGANSIYQTSDGGFIVAGYSYSDDGDLTENKGGYDYWIIKLNASGDIQWQKVYGGSNDDIAASIIQTSDGGYLIAGESYSTDGDVEGNHGSYTYDYWILKIDNSGNIQWSKNFGGSEDDIPHSIIQTSDGNYLIAGETTSYNGDIDYNHGWIDFWIIKLNQSGNIIWKKTFGGSSDDIAYSIIENSEGNYVIAGYTDSYDGDITNTNGADFWIVKIDPNGKLLSEKCFGGYYEERAYCIKQTSDEGYIIAGYTNSDDENIHTHGWEDFWIVKISTF